MTGLDCGSVYPNASPLASLTRWSMQLAAAKVTLVLDDQTLNHAAINH